MASSMHKDLQIMAGGRPKDRTNPYKFTPARRKAILTSISNRIPYELAAEANGICEDTLYEWLKIGRQHIAEGKDTDYADFSESIKKIEEERMLGHLNTINGAEAWQSQAWILERRWWKYFSSSAAVVEFNKRLDRMEKEEKGIDHGKANSKEEK
jgi:hypothetical protein